MRPRKGWGLLHERVTVWRWDGYLDGPDMIRLAAWARLERQPTGDLMGDVGSDGPTIASAQKRI